MEVVKREREGRLIPHWSSALLLFAAVTAWPGPGPEEYGRRTMPLTFAASGKCHSGGAIFALSPRPVSDPSVHSLLRVAEMGLRVQVLS